MTKNIILLCLFLTVCKKIKKGVAICKRMCYNVRGQEKWPISQTAKTSPSHGEDMGSIPVWVTNLQIPMVCSILAGFRSQRVCETLAYTPCAASFRSGRISSFLLRSILTKNPTVVPWDFFVLIRDSSEYVIWYHYKGIGKGNLHKNALSFYKILRFFRSLSVLVSL